MYVVLLFLFFSFPLLSMLLSPYIRNIILGVRKGGRRKSLPVLPKRKKRRGGKKGLKTVWLTIEVIIKKPIQIPGVDEAMSFAEVLKQVKSLSYETIIFDTAPTGHTLRFLQFPTVLEKALAKLSQLSTQFGPMLNTIIGARGGNSNNLLPGGQSLDEILRKMESLRETISEVNSQFKNAEMTTFVCVCIPEFLSLYETERMIQELTGYGIDTHAIVVNQLLFPKRTNECEQCNARRRMQKKYLEQIEELYDEFNVVKMPLLVDEVRGKERLERYMDLISFSLPSSLSLSPRLAAQVQVGGLFFSSFGLTLRYSQIFTASARCS